MLILTEEEKRRRYVEGLYRLPPVVPNTSGWSVDDWVQFIDSQGKWYDNIEEKKKDESGTGTLYG